MKTIKAIWVGCILFATACPVMGQVGQTPQLDIANDSLWSTLERHDLSDKGNWVSYAITYESGNDTLFVKNTNSLNPIAFAKGNNGLFTNEEQFACITDGNTFELLDLKTNQIQKIEDVSEYQYLNNGKQLLFVRNLNANTALEIRDKDLRVLKIITAVNKFAVNPGKTAIVYQTNVAGSSVVNCLSLENGLRTVKVTESETDSFQNFVWHKDGKAFAFVNQLKGPDESYSAKLFYYDISAKKQYSFELEKAKNWPKDMLIQSVITEALRISDDRTAVFFTVKKKRNEKELTDNKDVQIWNAADKDLFEFRKRYGDRASQNRLAVWYPQRSTFEIIGNEKQPSAMLLPNQKKAILMDPDAYKPQSKYTPDADYYLLDIPTGKKTSFIKEGFGDYRNIEFSPKGSYVLYAKDGIWWLYHVAGKTHYNLSKNTAANFFDQDIDTPEVAQPYGIAAWTKDEKELLLYDKHDIWQFTLGKNIVKRITKGRENNVIFRINKQSMESANSLSFSKPIITVNPDNEILLDAVIPDFSMSGYYSYQKDKGLKPIVFEDCKVSDVLKAEEQDVFLHVQQKYNQPPILKVIDKEQEQFKTIFESNKQYEEYNWGKSEIIEYKNAKGETLKGILFYPFDYKPEKQYPMVVHIYEKQLSALHTFENPSWHNSDGFNKSNFTSQGYFVLFPSIVYEIGNPGLSAVDCVVAATKQAIKNVPVDPKKIGLIGHSFGGYETNFIIAQTDIFAAAISGAGIMDFTSCYLSVGWSYAKDDTWRFENYQMRMGKTFFEDKEGYLNNSPIQHAEKVKTPLLSWTGNSDTQVNSFQSFEWYTALRRLRKKHVMLVYPNENHAIVNENYQKDLTVKIMQWFDHYLKDGKEQDWMAPQ
ncbi:prolyl oligopeptidase family serine peptidase [Flavobacterium pedocola]